MTTATITRTCTDRRCTDGLTMCPGCNGYGVLTMGGRKYRVRGHGKNIGPTAVAHQLCVGTGLVPCGCTDLDTATLTMITNQTEV